MFLLIVLFELPDFSGMAHLKNCLHCGKEVKVPTNRLSAFKYCSRSCGALHVREHCTTNCVVCGTAFTHISSRANKAKYCSRTCYYKGRIGKGLTEYECNHCHKKFNDSKSKNRKFCSRACVNKSEKETWKPTFTTIRKKLESRGKITQCQQCGYSEYPQILGVHHIDKNRNNNELSNLIVLCPICHSLAHMKHIAH